MNSTSLQDLISHRLGAIGAKRGVRELAIGKAPKAISDRWTPVQPPLSHVELDPTIQYDVISVMPDERSAIPVIQYETDYVIYANQGSEIEYLKVSYDDLSVSRMAHNCTGLLNYIAGHLYFNLGFQEDIIISITDHYRMPSVVTYIANTGIGTWEEFSESLISG